MRMGGIHRDPQGMDVQCHYSSYFNIMSMKQSPKPISGNSKLLPDVESAWNLAGKEDCVQHSSVYVNMANAM
jgi:hypothetical protein